MRKVSWQTRGSIASAYQEMVSQVKYQPTGSAEHYIEYWIEEEDSHSYNLGVPSLKGRRSLIFTVEAARMMNAMDMPRARLLLEMAIDALPAERDAE